MFGEIMEYSLNVAEWISNTTNRDGHTILAFQHSSQ